MKKKGGAVAFVMVVVLFLSVALSPQFLYFMLIGSGSSQGGASNICMIGGSGTGSGWANPMAGSISSTFGARNLGGDTRHHDGTDVVAPRAGMPFYSASSGKVLAAYGTGGSEGNGDGGYGIIIDAGSGVHLWYWHAEAGSTKVKAGQNVVAGQLLAKEGATGRATGAHLHFQVMVNGVAVDPVPFMKARGVVLGAGGPALTNTSAQTAAPASNGTNDGQKFQGTKSTGALVNLDARQLGYIDRVIAQGRKSGVNDKGIIIALVTGLQESKFYMYSNNRVRESWSIPHDREGSDHDSVGLFQQRPSMGWGTVADLMNPEKSALAFWGIKEPGTAHPPGLNQISGWQKMSVNDAAQAVQVSGVPDAYGPWEPVAKALLTRSGSGTTGQDVLCAAGDGYGAGQAMPANYHGEEAREKIIAAAKEGIGGSYVWGGTAFKAWDCSGYVSWAMTKAGIKGLPRTEQWTVGKKTTTPLPGDLVVQNPDGPNHWAHVGIYAGDGKMYSALNPTVGTLLHPVDWNPGSEYFTMVSK